MTPNQKTFLILWSTLVALIGLGISIMGVFTTGVDFWTGIGLVFAGLSVIWYTMYAVRMAKGE